MNGIVKIQDMIIDVPAKKLQIAAEGFLAHLKTDGSGLTLPSTGGNSTMDSLAISGCKPR